VKDVLPRLSQIPGADAVTATSDLPATGPGRVPFRIKGEADPRDSEQRTVVDSVVTSQFFDAAGIALLRGRLFTETDNHTAPHVVLVNQEFVKRYFHDQESLGKQIRLDVSGGAAEWSEIVGVVGDVKTFSEATNYDPEVYEAFLQRPVSSFSLMVRTSADPASLASALRNAVAQLDGELPLSAVMSMPACARAAKGRRCAFLANIGRVCAARAAARGNRHLRADRLFGGPAHARNRNPHGYGRRETASAALGAPRRVENGNHRRCDRTRVRVAAAEAFRLYVLWVSR